MEWALVETIITVATLTALIVPVGLHHLNVVRLTVIVHHVLCGGIAGVIFGAFCQLFQ